MCSFVTCTYRTNMDRTWITKPQGTREYNNGCREFVKFAVSNCRTTNGKIRCPCKMCWNNRLHSPDYVLEHLTASKGMMTSYINWWHHGQTTPYNPDVAIRSNHPATNAAGGTVEVQKRLATCTQCCVMHSACMKLDKRIVGLQVALRSTTTCLKRRRSHCMRALNIVMWCFKCTRKCTNRLQYSVCKCEVESTGKWSNIGVLFNQPHFNLVSKVWGLIQEQKTK